MILHRSVPIVAGTFLLASLCQAGAEGRNGRQAKREQPTIARTMGQTPKERADPGGEKPANPMVHQEGPRLVDEKGQPLFLRGVNVEGWLIWSGHSWGGKLVSEQQIRDHLDTVVGTEAAAKFDQSVCANFIRERDIQMMSELGFNVLRLVFNHEILEDDARPYTYKESGWRLLDQLLSWCEKHHVYLVPCLMSAPGGQSRWFLADPDRKLLWDDPENQRRTISLWKAIAARYRDRWIIAGYDLLNEPKTRKPKELLDLYKRIIQAVREVDPYHMMILEGTRSSMDFSMFKQPLCDNQMYSFHVYHLLLRKLIPDKSEEIAQTMKALSIRDQVPVWASEFGAQTPQWTKEKVAMFEDPASGVCGWAYWPWKRVPPQRFERDYMHLAAIRPSADWITFINSVGTRKAATTMSRKDALQAMEGFIEASKAENLVFDDEMLRILAPAKWPK